MYVLIFKIQFVSPLNSTKMNPTSTSSVPVTSGCKQHLLQSRMWAMESLSAMSVQIFRLEEEWDMLLRETLPPVMRVRVLVVWFDPVQMIQQLLNFDDRNVLISITRAITCGDRRFALQDGGQAFFYSVASWVYDLVPCFPDQAKSIWWGTNRNLYTKKELLLKYRIIFLSLIHVSCWNEKVFKMFEGLSYL